MKASVVILAGGQGTRFWPISRAAHPKQFLKLGNSELSMIQATASRMQKFVDEHPYVITGKNYLEHVKKHLPECRTIIEPCARNTAPAIGLAALHIRKNNPDAVMLVLPSDHSVENEELLIKALDAAAKLAYEKNMLVTIGVPPNSPNTGYGYIKIGDSISDRGFLVKRFYEKPSLERAVKYLEDGGYFWNSGMFAWKAAVILNQIKEYMPALYEGLMKIDAAIGTEQEELVTEDVFCNFEAQSIDFGVLEHSKQCAVITAEPFGWNDVGSWDAWASQFEKDQNGNFLKGQGVLLESNNCIVRSEQRFTAVLGCEDLVLIDTGDVILACHKDKLQDLKKMIAWLQEQNMTELI